MSQDTALGAGPSLTGVLVALNLILALVWVPLLNAADDPTHILNALIVVNVTATAWWMWACTSFRRRLCTLCGLTVSALRVLGAFSLVLLRVPWLIHLALKNGPSDELLCMPEGFMTGASQLRNEGHTMVVEESPPGNSSSYISLQGLAAPMANHDCKSSSSARPSPSSNPGRRKDTNSMTARYADGHTPTRSGAHHQAVLEGRRRTLITSADPSPQRCLANQPTTPHRIAPQLTTPSQESLTSVAPLPDLEDAEAVRLYREVLAVAKERDMYRERAYQLAMRLDDYHNTNANTASVLEHTQRRALKAERALGHLEAQRRDLSVALAATLTAAQGDGVARLAPLTTERAVTTTFTSGVPVGRGPTGAVPRTTTAAVFQTPDRASPADERPLLLPQTAEASDDTPTRARAVTWTPPGVHPPPSLEDIQREARRRAQVRAEAARVGLGALLEAQRTASARAIFSVIQAGIADDRARSPEEQPPMSAEQQAADEIVEELRWSRAPAPSPTSSPELETAEKHEGRREVPSTDEMPAAGDVRRRISSDVLSVPVHVLRQPRGPPPSPHGSQAYKGLAQAYQRTKEHTWRGRSTSAAGAITEPGLEPPQAYPGSRLPSRMRARQATAPPASTMSTSETVPPICMDSVMDPCPAELLPVAAMTMGPLVIPGGAPKVVLVPTTGADARGRRRHATYSGNGKENEYKDANSAQDVGARGQAR
ncbi:hypothetical protein C8Q77DRAFT_207737 [Trametes polyzona]|nr:hypothetical protein C8Q77DRAFT_207737 [Trametes polyzona]